MHLEGWGQRTRSNARRSSLGHPWRSSTLVHGGPTFRQIVVSSLALLSNFYRPSVDRGEGSASSGKLTN